MQLSTYGVCGKTFSWFLIYMEYIQFLFIAIFVTISFWFSWTLEHTCDSICFWDLPHMPFTERDFGVHAVSYWVLFWDVPRDVLAAPASALCGWKGVILLSLPTRRVKYSHQYSCLHKYTNALQCLRLAVKDEQVLCAGRDRHLSTRGETLIEIWGYAGR